jgi:oxaloacetate decarboxylase gamma subunit
MEIAISELLYSGVKLMLIGMSVVFLFLALLVWVIGFSSRIVQHYAPEPPNSLLAPGEYEFGPGEQTTQAELVAVISAAIHRHQNQS